MGVITRKDKAVKNMAAWHRSIQQYCYFLFGPFILFALLLNYQPSSAQNISISLKADSTHLLIGNPMSVKLSVKYSDDLTVTMPLVGDTLGNMDVLKESAIDTGISGNFKVLSQTFVVSAYDSGKFYISPQKIMYKNKKGIPDSVLSDFVFVQVTTVPVDTSKPIKDIKTPLGVPYSIKEFLPYVIGAYILFAILVIVVYLIWRFNRRKKVKPIERPKPREPAHIWARNELKKLDEEKLWQKDEIKMYYSRLTDILRMYLEYRFNWFALESTTEEIKDTIDSYNILTEAKDSLMFILNNADLVKFAKMTPLPDTHTKAMQNAYKFIDYTEQTELKKEEKSNV